MLDLHGNTFLLKQTGYCFNSFSLFYTTLQKIMGTFLWLSRLSLTSGVFTSWDQAFPFVCRKILSSRAAPSLILSPLWFGSAVALPEESAPVLSVAGFLSFIPKGLMGMFLEQMIIPGLKLMLLHTSALRFLLEGEVVGLLWSCGVPCHLERSLSETRVFVCAESLPCSPSVPHPVPLPFHVSWGSPVENFWLPYSSNVDVSRLAYLLTHS